MCVCVCVCVEGDSSEVIVHRFSCSPVPVLKAPEPPERLSVCSEYLCILCVYVNGCGELTCGPVFSLERRRRRDSTAQPAVMALQWREGAKKKNKKTREDGGR